MRFRDILKQQNLEDLLNANEFRKLLPYGAKGFINSVVEVVENNYRVFIDPDCDPDGYFSALTIKEMFDMIGYKNYVVGRHTYKRHSLTKEYIKWIVDQGFEACYILDSSSNSMEILRVMCSHCKVNVVVDHHRTQYKFKDYPENLIIVNPWIENNVKQSETIYDELSACALCSLLVDATLNLRYREKIAGMRYQNHFIYGYITLYSDSCKFNSYSIAYARKCKGIQFNLPPIVVYFMGDYDSLYKSFISYRMIPRINAMIRGEYFDLVWRLFFDFDSFSRIEGVRDLIEGIYLDSKKYVEELSEHCKINRLDSITLAILSDNCEPRARNYTGMVANKIMERYKQPCICLYNLNPTTYAGSVRDLYSRDLLTLFTQVCFADGHSPAFGVSIQKIEVDNVITLMNSMIQQLDESPDGLIVMDWDVYAGNMEDLRSDIALMAEYNEYAGQGIPYAYGLIKVNSEMKAFPSKASMKLFWRGLTFVLIGKTADRGDTLVVKPCMSNKQPELMVQSVGISH